MEITHLYLCHHGSSFPTKLKKRYRYDILKKIHSVLVKAEIVHGNDLRSFLASVKDTINLLSTQVFV
jgi:hypothetical protein